MPASRSARWRVVLVAASLLVSETVGGLAQVPPQLLPGQAQPNLYPNMNQGQPDVTGLTAPPGGRGVVRQGEPTQAEGGPSAPTAIGDLERRNFGAGVEPFGASLFTGAAPASSDTPNPAYRIQPGDRVAIRVWGGFDADTTATVDPDGNVFLQGVGPVRVAGVAASDLQSTIERDVGRVFTQRVYVYAVLITTHRVAVFVTGYVKRPGRYSGAASDTVLDYLIRAGGVDPTRGSYRDIVVQRGDRTLAAVDLYRFLIHGVLPKVDLREGDTIIVNRQHAMVKAEGAVRNGFLFEVLSMPLPGREIVELARPLPAATNVIVRGTRNEVPYARYATIEELQQVTLQDQDQVTFVTDAPSGTIRVRVEGSRLGPSVLVADRATRLTDVLDYIAIDPALADTKSVFLLRQSLAEQQQRAITEATDRLERELFLAISSTTGEAQIRASEANLVASYIQRARRVRPEGRLVVTDDDGTVAELRLEDGDTIVIPEKSQVVLVSGEVLSPQAVVYRPNVTAEEYVLRAGGYSQRGAEGNFLIRRANGQIILDPQARLRPGDELVVLPRVSTKYFQIAADFITVMYQVALAARVICNNC
jgi:protein involved in polysaccharide export with SLBB domain